MREEPIWEQVESKVSIQQKVITHKPHEKLLDVIINIVAGGDGIVEVNTRVRPEAGLPLAFGWEQYAKQSTISRTLDACRKTSVE